jgi:hypothetical protein
MPPKTPIGAYARIEATNVAFRAIVLKPDGSRFFETAASGPLHRSEKPRQSRDYVVHRGNIKLASHGTIGITEGRGIKSGINIPVNPLEDIDTAMERYLFAAARQGGARTHGPNPRRLFRAVASWTCGSGGFSG